MYRLRFYVTCSHYFAPFSNKFCILSSWKDIPHSYQRHLWDMLNPISRGWIMYIRGSKSTLISLHQVRSPVTFACGTQLLRKSVLDSVIRMWILVLFFIPVNSHYYNITSDQGNGCIRYLLFCFNESHNFNDLVFVFFSVDFLLFFHFESPNSLRSISYCSRSWIVEFSVLLF